jgi:hypothetical protein
MIDGEMARLISMDVANDVPPEKSKLTYGPEELEFYHRVKRDFEDYRKKHPNAILEIFE